MLNGSAVFIIGVCRHGVGRDNGARQLLPRTPQVELPNLGSPFASKPNVVAYDRHVVFAPDDAAGAARHRAPCPISTTRIDEAFVHELPEQREGLVFAQADALAYARDLGVRVYLALGKRTHEGARCDTMS